MPDPLPPPPPPTPIPGTRFYSTYGQNIIDLYRADPLVNSYYRDGTQMYGPFTLYRYLDGRDVEIWRDTISVVMVKDASMNALVLLRPQPSIDLPPIPPWTENCDLPNYVKPSTSEYNMTPALYAVLHAAVWDHDFPWQ